MSANSELLSMKLRPFRPRSSPANVPPSAPAPATSDPAARPAPVAAGPPRYYSLLLPPGFTPDRR